MAHNDRCKECKSRVHDMLEALYGKVAREAKVSIPARLDSYEATPAFEPLQKIYTALQAHRGFERFAMTKTLNRVDFLICASGLVVEFDESQHFTYPRYLSLANYPKDLEIGYNRERWMTLALKFDCHDNDPPHRDEQRAWYDTLRDFSSVLRQSPPTVRVFARDRLWCNFSVLSNQDLEEFRSCLGLSNAK